MQVIKLEEGIFEVVAPRVVDADQIHADLLFMERAGMLTFGDQTTRILVDKFQELGYTIELTDLCFDDDLSLGLQMPETWYLNRGLYALSISMYFNFLNYKEMAKAGHLYTKNVDVAEDFGRIAAVEVYMANELFPSLDREGRRYFGTPRTLTECMRVLEGWDLSQIERLKKYVTYADFIRLWCSVNFPGFRQEEWGMGKYASKQVFEATGTTNVREGIRYFWQHYLEPRPGKVAPEDIEVDILDPEFQAIRQPRYVLLGEDIFAEQSLDTGFEIVFRSFTDSKVIRSPRRTTANDMQYRTAKLVQQRFPQATIVMFRNPPSMPTFTMTKFDEVKEGVSREVAVVANGLSQVHKMLGGTNGR